MHKYFRRVWERMETFQTGVEVETEEAILQASSVNLFFHVSGSSNGTTYTYQSFPKAMPDLNRHVDFSKFKHIDPTEVKPYGLLNVGTRLTSTGGNGTIKLVYRNPGTVSDFILVPALEIPIHLPEGLSANRDFGIEGTTYYDMSMVPKGASLMVQMKSDGVGRLYARGVQLHIQFRREILT